MTADEIARQNLRENWEALCAMRNQINEVIPMPSIEADLLQGPETSVFCAAVASAVCDEIARIRAEALEEAARMADAALVGPDVDPYRDELLYRADVAAAIRALIPKEPS